MQSQTLVRIDQTLNLDPGVTAIIPIKISYNSKYTTVCIESLNCSFCNNSLTCSNANFGSNFQSSLLAVRQRK